MSTPFYDLASLVVVPSGYKASKVYAQKPLTTDGQLAFTRSTTATRVGPDGLIEKVRTNLALRSQSFATSAVWATVNGTITDNAGTAPDGTNTASKIVATNSDPFVYQALTLSGSVVASCYVKGIGSSIGKNASIRAFSTITNFTITGDWQRVSVAHTAGGAQNYGVEAPESAAVSDEVLLWGFQVEYGDVATDYIATTTAAVSVGPVANVPRLDYLNSSCPRLLLEPQRTNNAQYSEQFDNATWGSASVAITANQAVSPDGYTNADLLVNTGSTSYLYQGLGSPFSGTYTVSIFAKKGTQSSFAFGLVAGGFTGGMGVKFNFDTQTFSTPTNYGNFTSMSASYQSYGNGWYRLNLTGTTATSTTYFFVLGSLQETFTVNAYVYGAQVEAGAYATSYTPTLGASVTRGADAASKTGISSLIGQTEGTIFVEAILTHSAPFNEYLVQVRGNNSNRFFIFRNAATNKLGCYALVGATEIYTTLTAAAITGTVKAAFAYKSGSFAFYVNGVQVGTSSATYSLATALTEFFIDQNNGLENGYYTYAQSIVFPTRLSNSDLAALTA